MKLLELLESRAMMNMKKRMNDEMQAASRGVTELYDEDDTPIYVEWEYDDDTYHVIGFSLNPNGPFKEADRTTTNWYEWAEEELERKDPFQEKARAIYQKHKDDMDSYGDYKRDSMRDEGI